ncbi:GPI ethanolamine phosphate transferase 2 [Candida viswanathii]|uniref:GPI ethanolamine phosphate transferase 2 n=1 Tax=Candida viswanathii TaxID=5486 RepID=A0A367Y453_9ASCO|nr:GPI ethanolamine phosphate transferase 2 [Candida viswanathii]
MAKSFASKWIVQASLTLINLLGLIIFLRGFFPSKVVLPGYSTFEDAAKSPFLNPRGRPQFNRFILMVVDAMRSDFCFSEDSSFEFLHELINQGHALPFTAYSNPPTVTLPRLKGITTGGTPNFLDAILNIADDKDDSQGLFNQDSWVHQFKQSNGKSINFFGDDTWLKLFQGEFDEFEGTNSFFVSDFTEVDNNVTRHLDQQLSKGAQWDGLILHYLGLDHIGHKGGPESVYMKAKQIEMDMVLQRLYRYVSKNDDTLIVLVGDHGMNEIGNHGGSSIGETSAGLTFISPKFNHPNVAPLPKDPEYSYYHKINQIDLVPTLATLLNFPIPKNSLGVVSKEILEIWPEKKRHAILLENCRQIMDLYQAKHGKSGDVWKKWQELSLSEHPLTEYYEFLYDIQEEMASSATDYGYKDIYAGAAILLLTSVSTIVLFNRYFYSLPEMNIPLVIGYQLFVILYSFHFHGSSLIEEEHQIWYFFTTATLLFLGATVFDVFAKFSNLLNYGLLFACVRIIRSWNNSGQKYSTKFNIAYYLLHTNPNLMWLLVILTYAVAAIVMYTQGSFASTFTFASGRGVPDARDAGALISFIAVFVVTSVSFLFKLLQHFIDGNAIPRWLNLLLLWILDSYNVRLRNVNIEDNELKFQLQNVSIQLSRFTVFTLLGLLALRLIVGRIRSIKFGTVTDISNIVTIYLLHQTRQENIPLFLALIGAKFAIARIMYQKTARIDQYILTISLVVLCLQNLSFFCLGNTNLLATVDLSNAYNGVKSYDVFLVGLLTFISNFAGPIFWSFSGLQLLYEPSLVCFKGPASSDLIHFKGLKKSILLIKGLISLFFYAIAAVNLIGSCINLRFHLFIWTVFSPKLLFFGSWLLFVNILVDFIVATVVLYI